MVLGEHERDTKEVAPVAEADIPKIFRDPVYGFIQVDRNISLKVIDTKEFQRLRHIRQLGFTSFTYHGGEHTRFAHSLGVFHLFKQVAERLAQIGDPLDSHAVMVGSLAALLHDIEHGPFSHTLETVLTPRKHTDWTIDAILNEESSINKALREVDECLPDEIASVILGDYQNPILVHAISGQFDVDRMDYLLRDSWATGTSYGNFDLDRVLMTLRTHKDQLAFGDKYLAEQFIFARYFAYWQIYFHKTTRGIESLVKSIWKRAKRLYMDKQLEYVPSKISPFLGEGTVAFQDYFNIDDAGIIYAIKCWSKSDDNILRDLSLRLVQRRLFKSLDVSSLERLDISEIAKDVLIEAGYEEPDYYFLVDCPSDVPYDYYTVREEEEKPPIWVYDNNTGKFGEISKASDPIRSIASQRVRVTRIYLPDSDCVEKLRQILFGKGA